MDNSLPFSISSLPYKEATVDEEDSFYFLSRYFEINKFNYTYRTPKFSEQDMMTLTSRFCLFHASIIDEKTNESFIYNTPLIVFRYIMHADGSWSNYYTVKPLHGYIVEGMSWSNGMLYQLRDNKTDEIIERSLSINHLTKTLFMYPEP